LFVRQYDFVVTLSIAFNGPCRETQGIIEGSRVTSDIGVRVDAAFESDRI